jgi:hypothetical protein
MNCDTSSNQLRIPSLDDKQRQAKKVIPGIGKRGGVRSLEDVTSPRLPFVPQRVFLNHGIESWTAYATGI